jgi:hypothetical protein
MEKIDSDGNAHVRLNQATASTDVVGWGSGAAGFIVGYLAPAYPI